MKPDDGNEPFFLNPSGPVAFHNHDLIPRSWRPDYRPDACWVFNPAILSFHGCGLMVYRVVLSDMRRRMAICRLDPSLRVIPDSAMPLSDAIDDGAVWRADPRFFVWQTRLFVHYNDSYSARPNHIYLVELDADTLVPRAAARPLILEGPRREIEKNWMLFEHGGMALAVYSLSPHVILRLDVGREGPVACRRLFRTDWDTSDYSLPYGEPHGGCPPVRTGDAYFSFFHSRYSADPISRWWQLFRLRFGTERHAGGSPPSVSFPRNLNRLKRLYHRRYGRIRYVGGFYGFSAEPPFAPFCLSSEPVLSPMGDEMESRLPSLYPRNSSGMVYPCGAVTTGSGSWLVSYGVNNERVRVRAIDHEDLLAVSRRILPAQPATPEE